MKNIFKKSLEKVWQYNIFYYLSAIIKTQL